MKTKFSDGVNVDITAAPYAADSGAGIQVGAALFGVAVADIANAGAGVITTQGAFTLAKEPAVAFVVGDRLFWDNVNKRLSKTATASLCVGTCIVAAASADTTAVVRLGQPNASAA